MNSMPHHTEHHTGYGVLVTDDGPPRLANSHQGELPAVYKRRGDAEGLRSLLDGIGGMTARVVAVSVHVEAEELPAE